MKNKVIFIIALIIIIAAGLIYFSNSSSDEEKKFEKVRIQMVETQLIERGVIDRRVLDAMSKVKRHLFVPDPMKDSAYADHPLPIGEGQTISQPYVVALMTEMLALKGNEKVLEIGTGSGYQAAVLGELAKKVYTIEIFDYLADSARKRLKSMGYGNVYVKCGNGWLGWPEHAPFDAIIVTCAPDELPKALVSQLAEGGKMVIPVGELPYQELKIITKKNGKIEVENIIPVSFVPMLDKTQDVKLPVKNK
ncbi:MAG: protein-L-isoaspartate(D-aspartate) O-methyltransferase [Armatimonadota bacterium]